MNNFTKRAAAVLAAALMAFSAFSCGKKNSSSEDHDHGNQAGGSPDENVNLNQDQLPYGAQIKKLLPKEDGVKLGIEYDIRYITDEEAEKLSDYIYALGKKDTALFEESSYPGLLHHLSRLSEAESEQAYLDKQYDIIKGYTNGDFEFNYVQTDSCHSPEEGFDFSAADSLILALDPEAEISSRKLVEANIMYDEGRLALAYRMGYDLTFYVYTVNGQTCVFN